ncbi:MAG: hypothetical protein KGL39_48140 [Patescibacteria group bacterium]|nr:hypothetical protein [Patescibacteria group bacterium]
MPWTRFIPPASTTNGSNTGLKVSLRKTKHGEAKLLLNLSPKLAATWGFEENCLIEVLIGTGPEHGLLRLKRPSNPPTDGSCVEVVLRKTTKGEGYFLINLGSQPQFINRPESPRWVNWEGVEDGYFEVVLPLWADETGPKKSERVSPPVALASLKVEEVAAKKTVPPSVAEAANFKRTRRDVTSSIMGDPPKGRSALDMD